MSELHQALDSYLAVRRALGFKLDRAEHLLRLFIDYLHQQKSSCITTAMALAWVTQSNRASPKTMAGVLSAVRGFAKYLHASNSCHEVPPVDLIPYRTVRYQPYIYSDEDVAGLIQATQGIRHPFKAATYAILFSLLAVTGMRLGEAISLDSTDLYIDDAVLFIRNSKFQKSRELPLHSTTMDALSRYADKRDMSFSRPKTPSFFVSLSGTRLIIKNVHFTFQKLLRNAGLSERRPRPRIHDLRHSFAVKTIQRWYEGDLLVEPRLASLSTYLGHVSPSSTYRYLTATPELMSLAAKRLEHLP
jgi:integrase